jgi:hypothetical protein
MRVSELLHSQGELKAGAMLSETKQARRDRENLRSKIIRDQPHLYFYFQFALFSVEYLYES